MRGVTHTFDRRNYVHKDCTIIPSKLYSLCCVQLRCVVNAKLGWAVNINFFTRLQMGYFLPFVTVTFRVVRVYCAGHKCWYGRHWPINWSSLAGLKWPQCDIGLYTTARRPIKQRVCLSQLHCHPAVAGYNHVLCTVQSYTRTVI
ncbi:hypothetical protein BaRGS_00010757 [Batillaria attramentaria]|uniref:Uncharacterized protein n=1 Tax=Batillaria attramentaria TaxID=370345 RepID=A0ABD0LEV2_9CAEN